MKIGVLGAGITGLSIARLLNKYFEVEVIEKKEVCGGIARTKNVNGIAYHTIGGHCFNSKHKEVLDFVFNDVLSIDQWRKIKRKSFIQFQGHEVPYPIEFSVKEIYKFDPKLAIKIVADFLGSDNNAEYNNLDEWFRMQFGNTLAEEYFIPYNKKIWRNDPCNMDPEWVKDKLPIPNKQSFFESLISSNTKDVMPHAEFYYPISNNQNTFIEALANGINIKYNLDIQNIRYIDKQKQWEVNDGYFYDLIINTTPIDLLPAKIEGSPYNVLAAAGKLKYNKISNVLWSSQQTDKTWTYIPDIMHLFHRYIHIGSYFSPNQGYSISESIGNHSFEEMRENAKDDPFLIEALDYNQSEHAYVVFDENYASSTKTIKEYLKEIGIYSIGRFGEWQYYNMDICIKQSLDLAKRIISEYHI